MIQFFSWLGSSLDSVLLMIQVHKHDKRAGHMPINLKLLDEMGSSNSSVDCQHHGVPVTMRLFSVICIATSHYVTFTRTSLHRDSKWLYFDSMALRQGIIIKPAMVQSSVSCLHPLAPYLICHVFEFKSLILSCVSFYFYIYMAVRWFWEKLL